MAKVTIYRHPETGAPWWTLITPDEGESSADVHAMAENLSGGMHNDSGFSVLVIDKPHTVEVV